MKKSSILEYLYKITETFDFDGKEKFTANYISKQFNLSRNTISQYLNEYVQLGKVIKTHSRPVYFFHKECLETKYSVSFKTTNFDNIDELKKFLIEVKKPLNNFQKAIGFQDSLYYPIEQLKAAIKYPTDGLPVLINGPTGVGKSFLAHLMYEYAVDNKIIDTNHPFVVLNCAEFADNPELLTANLFGYVKGAFTGADTDKVGLIEESNGGFLFLDEVHCLSSNGQEKLFLFMDKAKFRKLGDNKTWHTSKVRIIFATTKNPEEALLKTLMRRIPIVVQIPALEERSGEERQHMVYHFLQVESQRIGKTIIISKQAYNVLLKVSFSGNVGELKNCIKHTCANAYMKQDQQTEHLSIHMNHLPYNLYGNIFAKNIEINALEDVKDMIVISQENTLYFDQTRCNRLINLYGKIITCFDNFYEEKIDIDTFTQKSLGYVDNYYDYLIFRNKNRNLNAKLDIIIHLLNNIFNMLENKYGLKMQNNMILILSQYILEYDHIKSYLKVNKHFERKEITRIFNYLQINFQKEYIMTMELVDFINKNLDVELDTMDIVIFILNIKSIHKNKNTNKILGIILSHGYSTASSIADAANKLIGQYVYEAIDMPLDVSTETILFRLKRYLNRMHTFKEVILLVDMGSLKDIYKGLESFEDRTIGIINNITTKLALDIGSKIVQGKEMESILKESSENIYSTYRIIRPKNKKKAIITVCATGIGTAEKFSELLKTSIPSKVDLDIIAYDYERLSRNKKNDEVFKKYDVDLILGTLNPDIEGSTFVAIEDIISGKGIDVLKKSLIEYLSEEELEIINNNIVKNFSLQNVLNHLTILNADKILDYIEDALNKLQIALEQKLSNKIFIGLYVHLSCLIERLIMKNPIKTYYNIESFIKEHKDFMQIVKNSFSVIEKVYSVEIPEAEIGYIYDIISNECDI
ncbi:sigma 54-interacting transcriptional regulator [Abyssisolibacter fermentans]|uniref:sigma 54-interacting transcriptional regulator n=1 Tax=Abyssisolibacter fermentans TaxID=1766203 RepID=UPI00082C9535|nr:sigma-54-dependent transcriptional regulator [Abyssisolibacter fermentans]